ncbi:hypothetical protein Pst134EA_006823 [Puccinia striiformis f. sp. tritici]|uniref:hypothetical protein n=1 Tax=Puccinia striiformis f. sp. tritici TaxID=168172 RepID=UPI002007D93E|nr:hypothetical protein Pst134EA_006823 [Puccinia striiformis f. sp. tritici]KAH9469528.1 hypothetical protein Pst134EA_006823 [Puccinia striiformis f. sp. tritici]
MDKLLKSLGLRASDLKPLQLIRNMSSVGRSSSSNTPAGTVTKRKGSKGKEAMEPLEIHYDEKTDSIDKTFGTPSTSSVVLTEEDIKSTNIDSDHEISLIPLTDNTEALVVTVRSLVVGFMVAVLGASVTQLFLFKPVHMRLQPAFLQITAMLLGRAAALIPGPKWWNPGPFGMKETVFSSLIATSASVGAYAIELLAAQELFFDRVSTFGMSFGILLSSQLIGYGWAGLLQPILVYPSQVFYPEILPSVSLFYSLCGDGPVAKDQIKFFKRAFVAMGIYEIFPAYIAPAFQAVSVFCLTLPKNQLITNIFGGAQPFEGLGFLNISGDWALVGAHGPLYTPLHAQVHHIIGVLLSLFILSFVYTNSWYDAGINQNFPFMSVSLLTTNGTTYPIKTVINKNGSPNEEVISQIGIPSFTSTYVIIQIVASLAMTSAITHVLLENYPLILGIFKKTEKTVQIDPHRQLCMKYKDFPKWAFGLILIFSISLAMGLSSLSESGLPPLGMLFAIFLSSILTLAVGFLNAANTCISPQTLVVLAQMIGTFIGIFVNYGVMKTIIHSQREILLTSGGDGVFSGVAITSFQSAAVSWGAFAQRMFLADEKYGAIPLALVVGLFLPVPFFVIHRFWPRYKLNMVNVPLLAGSMASGYTVATAGRLVNILIGLASQFWARRYRPRWFMKYNYVLSAALDGGAQIIILFLSMVFQGGDGAKVTFPTYFLNPAPSMPRDYCYMTPKLTSSD